MLGPGKWTAPDYFSFFEMNVLEFIFEIEFGIYRQLFGDNWTSKEENVYSGGLIPYFSTKRRLVYEHDF